MLLGLVSLALVPACADDGAASGYGYTSANADQGDESGASAGDDHTGDAGGGGEASDGEAGDAEAGESGEGEDDEGADHGEAGDDSGHTGDGDGDDPGVSCEEFISNVAPVPPEVMFLLDRSGSMMGTGFDANAPGKTRWHALHQAVESVVGGGADSHIAFGAKTFSTKGEGACGVSSTPDVPIGLDHAAILLASIPGPLEVVTGGTPTNLALAHTMAHMASYESDAEKFIFLITDGRIGCVDDDAQATADAVAVLDDGVAAHGIKTYVVGVAPLANASFLAQLNAMAVAGGAPKPGDEKFYRADDADALALALAEAVEQSNANSCLLNLQAPPPFPLFTKVVIDGTAYGLVDDCDSENGFIYTNPELTQIRMCGLGCAAMVEFQGGQVHYFCMPG